MGRIRFWVLLSAVFILSIFASMSFISAGELNVTEEHPFLVDGEWISASQLQVGDELTTIDGEKVKITEIEDIEVPENESFLVYNLEAGKYSDFVVDGDGAEGLEGVVVHNSKLLSEDNSVRLAKKSRRSFFDKTFNRIFRPSRELILQEYVARANQDLYALEVELTPLLNQISDPSFKDKIWDLVFDLREKGVRFAYLDKYESFKLLNIRGTAGFYVPFTNGNSIVMVTRSGNVLSDLKSLYHEMGHALKQLGYSDVPLNLEVLRPFITGASGTSFKIVNFHSKFLGPEIGKLTEAEVNFIEEVIVDYNARVLLIRSTGGYVTDYDILLEDVFKWAARNYRAKKGYSPGVLSSGRTQLRGSVDADIDFEKISLVKDFLKPAMITAGVAGPASFGGVLLVDIYKKSSGTSEPAAVTFCNPGDEGCTTEFTDFDGSSTP